MTYLLIGLIVLIAAVMAILFMSSPGKLPPMKDAQGNIIDGSISERTWVDIGGIRQGMFIRGENRAKPVILYVHGAPGRQCYSLFLSWKSRMLNALKSTLLFATGISVALA
jgi:hypothetical protein